LFTDGLGSKVCSGLGLFHNSHFFFPPIFLRFLHSLPPFFFQLFIQIQREDDSFNTGRVIRLTKSINQCEELLRQRDHNTSAAMSSIQASASSTTPAVDSSDHPAPSYEQATDATPQSSSSTATSSAVSAPEKAAAPTLSRAQGVNMLHPARTCSIIRDALLSRPSFPSFTSPVWIMLMSGCKNVMHHLSNANVMSCY
jgi:hypothetical protein